MSGPTAERLGKKPGTLTATKTTQPEVRLGKPTPLESEPEGPTPRQEEPKPVIRRLPPVNSPEQSQGEPEQRGREVSVNLTPAQGSLSVRGPNGSITAGMQFRDGEQPGSAYGSFQTEQLGGYIKGNKQSTEFGVVLPELQTPLGGTASLDLAGNISRREGEQPQQQNNVLIGGRYSNGPLELNLKGKVPIHAHHHSGDYPGMTQEKPSVGLEMSWKIGPAKRR